MPAHRSLVVQSLAVAALAFAMPASAQSIAKPAPAAKAAGNKSADAAAALAAGTKAFESGKTDAAVEALSAAISSGSLKNSELAKAMFYRGVAYRTQKRPAAALSDLNAAVWLRDGLSATDKAVAEDHRQAVLREVAVLDGPPPAAVSATAVPPAVFDVAAAPAPSAPAVAPVISAPAVAPVISAPAVAPVISAPAVATPMPWAATPVTPDPAPTVAGPSPLPWAKAEAAAVNETDDTIAEPVAGIAPVERAGLATVHAEAAPPEKPLPWQMATVEPPPAPATAPAEPVVTAAAPVATSFAEDHASGASAVLTPIASAPAALADAGKAAGAFFGSLFSGGPAAPSDEPAQQLATAETMAPNGPPIETASLPEAPKPVQSATVVWPTETAATPIVRDVPTPPAPLEKVSVAAAEASPAVDAVSSVASLPGPYRLQIAAENSRAEAEQTLYRLIAAHQPSLRGLEPVIEEPSTGGVLFGSMGAAYRVSVGPYASTLEPSRLCNILQPHGFDCRVVAIAP